MRQAVTTKVKTNKKAPYMGRYVRIRPQGKRKVFEEVWLIWQPG
jgi:hypothetical protein